MKQQLSAPGPTTQNFVGDGHDAQVVGAKVGVANVRELKTSLGTSVLGLLL
jgi:hypothetical protein